MPSVTARKKPQQTASRQKVAHARAAEPKLVKGRRDFFKYRDLGVADASAGALRAQVMSSSQGMSRPTGWHFHECDGQFIYMIKGWVDLEMADGTKHRVKAGQTMFIPGGLPHNETATSEVFELIEVCVPSNMGTVPCDKPAGL